MMAAILKYEGFGEQVIKWLNTSEPYYHSCRYHSLVLGTRGGPPLRCHCIPTYRKSNKNTIEDSHKTFVFDRIFALLDCSQFESLS